MVIELSLSFDFEETHQSVVSGSLKRAEKLLSIRGYNRNNLISLIRLRVISRYRAAAPPASLSSSPRTENYVTLCDATPAVHRRLEENFQEETRFGRFWAQKGPRAPARSRSLCRIEPAIPGNLESTCVPVHQKCPGPDLHQSEVNSPCVGPV